MNRQFAEPAVAEFGAFSAKIPLRSERIRRLRQEHQECIETVHKRENGGLRRIRVLGIYRNPKHFLRGINVVGFGDHGFEVGEVFNAASSEESVGHCVRIAVGNSPSTRRRTRAGNAVSAFSCS